MGCESIFGPPEQRHESNRMFLFSETPCASIIEYLFMTQRAPQQQNILTFATLAPKRLNKITQVSGVVRHQPSMRFISKN